MMYDVETVLRASLFATQAHDGQRRKFDDEPYIVHPFRVARRVATTEGATTDMVVAALLHDVLEDCPQVVPNEINMAFGDTVRSYVDLLTDPPTVVGGPNRMMRKKMTMERFRNASGHVHTIKVADLLDNTPSIVLHDMNFRHVYLREALSLRRVLVNAEATIMDELDGVMEWAQNYVSCGQPTA